MTTANMYRLHRNDERLVQRIRIRCCQSTKPYHETFSRNYFFTSHPVRGSKTLQGQTEFFKQETGYLQQS